MKDWRSYGRIAAWSTSTLRHLGWFEVVQIRGGVESDQVRRYQVTLKVGFTLEED
jgi:dodecin